MKIAVTEREVLSIVTNHIRCMMPTMKVVDAKTEYNGVNIYLENPAYQEEPKKEAAKEPQP